MHLLMLSFTLQTEDKHNSKSAKSQMLVTIIVPLKTKALCAGYRERQEHETKARTQPRLLRQRWQGSGELTVFKCGSGDINKSLTTKTPN